MLTRLREYRWTGHLIGDRVRHGRNILLQALHAQRRTPGQDAVIAALRRLCADRPLAITVAFNTPVVIAVWVDRMTRLAPDSVLLVCDNSRDRAARRAIAAICGAAGVAYLPVPQLRIPMRRNGSRSHGMALTWIFRNLVRAVRPKVFAFLDHDLFPVAPIDLAGCVATQAVYGLGSRDIDDASRPWALWAGLSVFRFDDVASAPLDFTADHPIGLDTGGQNWHRLYRTLDRAQLTFARKLDVALTPLAGPAITVELIDGFAHLGDASRRAARGEDFAAVETCLAALERQLASQRESPAAFDDANRGRYGWAS